MLTPRGVCKTLNDIRTCAASCCCFSTYQLANVIGHFSSLVGFCVFCFIPPFFSPRKCSSWKNFFRAPLSRQKWIKQDAYSVVENILARLQRRASNNDGVSVTLSNARKLRSKRRILKTSGAMSYVTNFSFVPPPPLCYLSISMLSCFPDPIK